MFEPKPSKYKDISSVKHLDWAEANKRIEKFNLERFRKNDK